MFRNNISYNESDITVLSAADNVYHGLRIFIVSVVSIFIIISNSLNLYILSQKCHVPKISRIFLLNLSFSDLCVGLISCLPTIYSAITNIWPYGPVWCQISGVVHTTSCAISIWSISTVSIERYLAICKPMTYNTWKSTKKAIVVMACLWTLAFGTFLTPILTKADFIYYQFDKDENMCGIYWEYKWFCIIASIYFPILSGSILVFTNVKIIRTVITRRSGLRTNDCNSSVRMLQGKSAAKLLLATSSIFFIMWGPYVVSVLLQSFSNGFKISGRLRFFFMWLANSNSFMNVIAFSVVYRTFRHEMKLLILKCLCYCNFKTICKTDSSGPENTSDYIEMRLSNGLSSTSTRMSYTSRPIVDA